MNTNPSPALSVGSGNAVSPLHRDRGAAAERSVREPPARRAESLQKAGRVMILTGFVITILGVVSYCAVCFAGGMDAEVGDALFRNALPFGRTTLAVLGLGTLVWLAGSFTYLRGAMDADEDAPDHD